MAIQKASGGVEDLLFGMGTVQQERKGQVIVITEINGTKIPYNATLTINERIDQVDSQVDPIRTDLDNHKADNTNPHNVTATQTGAEPYLGAPSVSGAILASDELGNRQWITISGFVVSWGDIQGDINNQTDLIAELDKRVSTMGGDSLQGIYDIDGSLVVDEYLAANLLFATSNIDAGGEIRALNSLGTGTNPNGNSAIQFNVTSQNVGPGVLFYDNTDKEFKVDVVADEGYTLWHSGNYTPNVIDYVQGNIGTSYTPDLSNITAFFLNVTEDNGVIENPTNMQAGKSGKFIIGQDDVGRAGLTWGSAYLFETGGDNTMPTDPYAQMIISFVVRGSVLLCTIESKFGSIPADTTPPVITILGDNPLDHTVNTPYTDPGATAMDDVDGDITNQIVVVNNVDEDTEGTYTVTYNVSDMAGNPAQEQVRTVNVIAVELFAPIFNFEINPFFDVNDGYYYVFDESTQTYTGKLLNNVGGSWTSQEVSARIDIDRNTVDLSGDYSIECTAWEAPQTEEWNLTGFVEVTTSSYQMYTIHYLGDNTADIYFGSEDTSLSLLEAAKAYIPPTGNYIITNDLPDVVTPPAPIYGPELIANGDFSDDLNYWYRINGVSVVINGELRFGNGTSGFNAIGQEIGEVQVGDTYKVSIDIIDVQGTFYPDEFYVGFSDSTDPSTMFSMVNILGVQVDGPKTIENEFQIPPLENGATKWDVIEIWDGFDTGGYEYSTIDNFSLKKRESI